MSKYSVEIKYKTANGIEKRNKQTIAHQDAEKAIVEAIRKFKKNNKNIVIVSANCV